MRNDENPADRVLLVSDVDGTLLHGDDEAVRRFARWRRQNAGRFVLAYASGRFCGSLLETIRTTPLPEPDYLIGGVGTQLLEFFSRRAVVGWESRFSAFDGEAVRHTLDHHSRLILQPAEFLSDTKISYYFLDAADADIEAIRLQLAEAGLPCEVVYSSRRDLDVLPKGASKGAAAAHLARRLGVRRVIGCGDSANDASLLRRDFFGIVVQNALPELKRLARESARTFLSELEAADGVLDGIRHWLDSPEWAAESGIDLDDGSLGIAASGHS